MKNRINQLLDAGEDLIGLIEDAHETVEEQLSVIGGSANEIDSALADLSRQADHLHREIVALRNADPATADPVAIATTEAIDNLITLLTEAKNYFAAGDILAAIGTLLMFEVHAEDLKAAFRLCKMAQGRKS